MVKFTLAWNKPNTYEPRSSAPLCLSLSLSTQYIFDTSSIHLTLIFFFNSVFSSVAFPLSIIPFNKILPTHTFLDNHYFPPLCHVVYRLSFSTLSLSMTLISQSQSFIRTTTPRFWQRKMNTISLLSEQYISFFLFFFFCVSFNVR